MLAVFFVVIRWLSQPKVVQNREVSVNEWSCNFGNARFRKVCPDPQAGYCHKGGLIRN